MPLLLILLFFSLPSPLAAEPDPSPTPWPAQFHATLVMEYKAQLSMTDLWYDWPRGRNLHIIRDQLAGSTPRYDVEWNNGTSFYYTLGLPPAQRSCRTVHFEVGILRPEWLVDGAAYLGREVVNGFECHAWSKADFITYYEDGPSKRPVKWVFYTGRTAHVMTFEVGAVLENAEWQAPDYCFVKEEAAKNPQALVSDGYGENLMPKRMLRG